MKNIISIFCALFITSTFAFAQPKIEIIGGDTYDWGKVAPPTSGQLEATIRIKNVGTDTLFLTNIKPGCGCTKTDPDKTKLGRGEVSTMGVKLNISPSQNGNVTKNITVYSNSAGTDSIKTIWLKADIFRQVAFEPTNYFSMSQVVVGTESFATVTVVNNSDNKLTLSDFAVPENYKLNVNGKVDVPSKGKIELTLTTIPKIAGQINSKLMFKTTNPENPTVELAVYGTVQADTTVDPKTPAK